MDADVRARVVTPTCGVRLQCNSHGASSPAGSGGPPSTDAQPSRILWQRAVDAVVMPSSLLRRRRATVAVLLLCAATTAPFAAAVAADPAQGPTPAAAVPDTAGSTWRWPADTARIVAPYDAPAHAFAAGHRGIDVLAPVGTLLRAPADGVVAFVGIVVDRGVVTIDHGDGHVSSLEPVEPVVTLGTSVRAGDVVAVAAVGGHAEPGSVHFGVRRHARYIDPLELLGPLPRAVLLPCC